MEGFSTARRAESDCVFGEGAPSPLITSWGSGERCKVSIVVRGRGRATVFPDFKCTGRLSCCVRAAFYAKKLYAVQRGNGSVKPWLHM